MYTAMNVDRKYVKHVVAAIVQIAKTPLVQMGDEANDERPVRAL